MGGGKSSGSRSSASGTRAAAPAAVEAQAPLDISQLTTEQLQAELARRQTQQQVAVANQPVPADLAKKTQEIFLELLNEKYSFGQLVPIHEIRNEVRRRFGENSARHEHFDATIKALHRQGALRMLPINDLTRASQKQLNDSIPGTSTAWFYAEARN